MSRLLLLKLFLLNLVFFLCKQTSAQELKDVRFEANYLTGFTAPSNENFPKRKLHKQLLLKIDQPSKGAKHFYKLRSGISLAITDFGNSKELGFGFSIIPYLQFPLFNKTTLHFNTGIGGSYFTKKYDFENNFHNRAVSTHMTWSFYTFISYEVLKFEPVKISVTSGFTHHSNGHLKLPNNGYNSFLLGIGLQFQKDSNSLESNKSKSLSNYVKKWYWQTSMGVGQNVFNDQPPFNQRKEVFTISSELGVNFHKKFKVGIGTFFRHYEHYHEYLSNNESLVQDGREFSGLKSRPFWNSSAIALYTKGEVLLNHIGVALSIGLNLHKPAYAIDWRINEGWDFAPRDIPDPPAWQLGDFDKKYRLKKLINGRLGVKYYLNDLQEQKSSNWFAGIFLNTNLGQADFSEFSIGYVKNL